MENKKSDVPYYIFEEIQDANEKAQERADKKNFRLVVIVVILIIALLATNAGWLVYESMYETVSYSQDGEGLNNVNVGDQGDVNYGADSND